MMAGIQGTDFNGRLAERFLPTPARERVRAILLDDDPIDREAVVRASKGGAQLDIAYTQCSSADEARATLQGSRFDVIIVDYWLGKETSIPFICDIRKEFKLPIVLLTGLDAPDIRRCAFRAGIGGFLSKDALVVQAIESAVLSALHAAEIEAS